MTEVLQRLQPALADRYTIERELGSGGMAVVYLAHDIKHDRPVAIKILKPELAASLGADRFLGEIEIAAKLTDPHTYRCTTQACRDKELNSERKRQGLAAAKKTTFDGVADGTFSFRPAVPVVHHHQLHPSP